MKHTPGPMEVCEPGDYGDYDGDCVVVCADDRRIAVFLGSDEESKANARLFAAQSDLLKALKMFMDMWGSRDATSPWNRAVKRRAAMWSAARAAIAKAEGADPATGAASARNTAPEAKP